MKTRLLLFLIIVGLQSFGQKCRTSDSNISEDLYNPINIVEITERMPRSNGKIYKSMWHKWSSVDYIKKGSNIHIALKKKILDSLKMNMDIQIIAYLQRKDKSIKPLTVSGFTKVISTVNKVEDLKQNSLDTNSSGSTQISYSYSIERTNKVNPSYSGEVNLTEEEISEDDKVIIYFENTKVNGSGFTQTFIYDDFGWKQKPIGGFSFVKIAESGFTEFSPAASLGYSFRYQPRKSSRFTNHFFSPAFGPMLHVFQNGNDTTIGAGLFLSSFYNMVNIGGGWTINGVNHGKPYIAIGLNFIESYNTITNLLK